MNVDVSQYNDWYKEREAAFKLEWQIIKDKLSQGIGGIEWLVLQVVVDESKSHSLNMWLRLVGRHQKENPEAVMQDAFIMDSDTFYRLYEINWWITIDDALTYLSMLRQRDYNRYSDFLRELGRRGRKYG